MKGTKFKSPPSWKKLDLVRGLPAPFIATRYPDGRIDLASKDPRRAQEVHEKDLCHLCGDPISEAGDGRPSVLLSIQQLSVGVAVEERAHFVCLGHATAICPHLARTGPHIIATCEQVQSVIRPVDRMVTNSLTVLGSVSFLATIDRGVLLKQIELPDETADDRRGLPDRDDYRGLALLASRLERVSDKDAERDAA